MEGEPFLRRIDEDIDYNWIKNRIQGMDDENFSVKWTGQLEAPLSGEYTIGIEADDGFRLYIDDVELINNWEKRTGRRKEELIFMESGRSYKLRVEYFQATYLSACKMSWTLPGKTPEDRAVELAEKSDAVIFGGGITPEMEGEAGDKSGIDFPEVQRSLLSSLKEVNQNIILVLNNGLALAIKQEKEIIPAILEAWYPGEEGGTAIADIIFGKHNPSGRLPITFYKSENDLPPFENYFMEGRTYRYFEKEALFPFGFGLSYSSFEYGDIELENKVADKCGLNYVSVKVKNIGQIAGTEIVQLYIRDIESSVVRPLKDLKGIKRVYLEPGEERTVKFTIDETSLGYTDQVTKEIIVESGVFEIQVGGSSDKYISTKLRIK